VVRLDNLQQHMDILLEVVLPLLQHTIILLINSHLLQTQMPQMLVIYQVRSSFSSTGQSSTTHGYSSGGYIPPSPRVNTIDKFPFASDTNATDVGDLIVARKSMTGQSSTASGYVSGGYGGSPVASSNVIDKFPFLQIQMLLI
jgi:hypothetical protein